MDSRTIDISDFNCTACGLPDHLIGGVCNHCRNVPRGQRVPTVWQTVKETVAMKWNGISRDLKVLWLVLFVAAMVAAAGLWIAGRFRDL